MLKACLNQSRNMPKSPNRAKIMLTWANHGQCFLCGLATDHEKIDRNGCQYVFSSLGDEHNIVSVVLLC